MAIIFKTKAKLYEDDMFVVNWLNEHNIKGSLIQRRGAITVFRLRKTGMTTHFDCEIHYKKVDLLQYLEHLDKALTERAEQEENAKQCDLLSRRIDRLVKIGTALSNREAWKLHDEYYRLMPSKKAHTYRDGNDSIYAEWEYDDIEFDYWENFINDSRWRLDIVDYIPVYEED